MTDDMGNNVRDFKSKSAFSEEIQGRNPGSELLGLVDRATEEPSELIHVAGRRRERATTATVVQIAREAGARLAGCASFPKEPAATSALGVALEVADDPSKQTPEGLLQVLDAMNNEHAVVAMGNTVRYLYRTFDAAGQAELRFLRADDMEALYAASAFRQRDGRKASAFAMWRAWPKRLQYAGVGMFPPPMSPPLGYLNLWAGFAVTPRAGEWSKFRRHIRDVLCGGDEALDAWVMDWLAHMMQRPDEKPGSAIVLKSEAKGTGKTVLNTFLKRILGVHATSVSKSEHVVGRFNGHLARNVLLGVEEAFWAGNKAATGALKNLITESRLAVEMKGVDAFDAPNYTRLIFTSNEDWAVPVGIDERRFLVLEVHNPQANQREYFDPIFDEMGNGGLEAMLYDLLNRPITSNLRRPPETDALVSQREHSLAAMERWVWTVAREGELADPATGDPIVLDEDKPTDLPRAVVIAAAKRACGQYEGRAVDVGLGALLARLGVAKGREGGGQRRHTYKFPALAVLKDAVERELRVGCWTSRGPAQPLVGVAGARTRSE